MKPRTEEFLYFLLWTAETLVRPNWRHFDSDTFEGWAWRSGFGQRLTELHRQQLLERAPAPDGAVIVRLTEAGRRFAVGGRDPEERWARPWDGKWRLVLFDIARRDSALRYRLWRYLREQGCGYLQGSVWVSPDPLAPASLARGSGRGSVESLVLMEGRPYGGESDEAIVDGAWNFPDLNRRYEVYLRILHQAPRRGAGEAVAAWVRRERAAWYDAVSRDPLLPAVLLPAGYLGRRAWRERKEVIARIMKSTAPAAAPCPVPR